MTHKKRGGLLSLDIIAWIALALILFGIGTYVGADLVHAYRTDLLRQQASSIDQALLLYSRSHQTTGSVVVKKGNGTKSVQAETLPTYPAEITSLGVIKEVKDYLSWAGYRILLTHGTLHQHEDLKRYDRSHEGVLPL